MAFNTPETFADADGDELEIMFDPTDGTLRLAINESDDVVMFDVETGSDLVKFLVEQFNSLAPMPLVSDVLPIATGAEDPRENWNATALAAAEELGLSVKFNYSKSDNAPIEPRGLAEVWEVDEVKGNLLVTGADEDRSGDVRSFRVDRIKGYVTVAS